MATSSVPVGVLFPLERPRAQCLLVVTATEITCSTQGMLYTQAKQYSREDHQSIEVCMAGAVFFLVPSI